jgi:hypothetical protein
MFEKKYKKNTTGCGTSNAVDPAKRGLKRMRIERDMLDFRPEAERASQPSRGKRSVMGLIAPSFLGTARHPVHPLPLAFGGLTGE